MKEITNLKAYERFLTVTGRTIQFFLIDERLSIYSVWIDYDYSCKIIHYK